MRYNAFALLVLSALAALPGRSQGDDPIHKIRHVVIIMQENRSFDSYFGTFPGANGIPMANGVPSVCLPDPQQGGCVRPFHDRNDRNVGGPHSGSAAIADIDGGKMDGFLVAARGRARRLCREPKFSELRRHERSNGISRRPGASELLEVCARFRAAGSSFRAKRILELAAAPLHGFRVVREMSRERRSDELRQ